MQSFPSHEEEHTKWRDDDVTDKINHPNGLSLSLRKHSHQLFPECDKLYNIFNGQFAPPEEDV